VIHVADAGPRLIIRLDDDGVGFQDDARPPWSISSRAVALGGTVDIVRNGEPGAHVAVSMPCG
jgi:signal transduction histidine kinase